VSKRSLHLSPCEGCKDLRRGGQRYLLMPTARDRSGAPIARLHSARVRVTTPPPCSGRPPRGARKVLNEAGACVARERAAIPTPIIDLIAIFAFSLRQEGFRMFLKRFSGFTSFYPWQPLGSPACNDARALASAASAHGYCAVQTAVHIPENFQSASSLDLGESK
jgi:hypothetical protein